MSLSWWTITVESLKWNSPKLLHLLIGFLCPSRRKMGHSLSVTISRSTWKKMESSTGEPRPYRHRQMVRLRDIVVSRNRSILKRLRIAQAEGRNWRSEMDDFLMMYRCCLEDTSGPNLPQMQEFTVEDEVRDHDRQKEREREGVCELQKKPAWKQDSKRWGDNRRKTNCRRHTNSLHLQFFRTMVRCSCWGRWRTEPSKCDPYEKVSGDKVP